MNRIKQVAEVPGDGLLNEQEAVGRLGLSTNRVRWLIMNGHLRRGVTEDSAVGGITRESVERESEWRKNATASSRLRRVLSYTFTWMP